MAESKPILVSGVKPTGDLHIGNYFGAMRQFVDLARSGKYKVMVFVADYHALNTMQDAAEMRRRTKELVTAYLAIGLDPEEVTFFKQSDVPAHTELAWIFDTITTMPYLMRAHAFKDAEAKNKEINVGTFNYPMLMAADILLYDAAVVPVGQDQKQHIEFARDTAEKFNRTFKTNLFRQPEAHIMPNVAIVPGTDGRKMSKSYGNVIPLFASHDELVRRVMSIVTDSSQGAVEFPASAHVLAFAGAPMNVLNIHRLVKSDSDLAPVYEEYRGNYKRLKEILIDDLERFIAPLRANYLELMQNEAVVERVLNQGGQEAREMSEAKMAEVRKAIGVA